MDTPSGLQEVIDLAVQMLSRGQRFSMPGRVESYNAGRQTVDVIPQFRDVVDSDDPDEPFEYFDLSIIPDVPIAWMSSLNGTLSITMPMQAKDPVTLIFTDYDHGQYREKGLPSEPGDLRAHGLSGAYAYPGGIRPNKEKIAAANVEAAHMVIAGPLMLGKGALLIAPGASDGVVQGQGIEPSTGLTYAALGIASAKVFAEK